MFGYFNMNLSCFFFSFYFYGFPQDLFRTLISIQIRFKGESDNSESSLHTSLCRWHVFSSVGKGVVTAHSQEKNSWSE